jgi:hypothetical protein
MDLLTTYIYHSELQVITVPPLISKTHKSPQHPLSLFQRAVCSPAVPWQRLLTVEILQLNALRSYLHSLTCRTAYQLTTDFVSPTVFKKTPWHWTHRNRGSSIIGCIFVAVETCLPSRCCPSNSVVS